MFKIYKHEYFDCSFYTGVTVLRSANQERNHSIRSVLIKAARRMKLQKGSYGR